MWTEIEAAVAEIEDGAIFTLTEEEWLMELLRELEQEKEQWKTIKSGVAQ